MSTFYKVLKGYTAQARWYAEHMAPSNDAGDWTDLGWTKLGNGAVKPVFKMVDGTPVVILNGKTHLHAVISEVPAACIFTTEDAARESKGGW